MASLITRWYLSKIMVPRVEIEAHSAEHARLKAILEEKERRIHELLDGSEKLQKELYATKESQHIVEAEKEMFRKRTEEHSTELKALHEKVRIEFENVANKIFEEKTKTFRLTSQENITQLLTPFREDLQGFKKKMEESFNDEVRERYSLKKEIERVCTMNSEMKLETAHLTKALKGDVKTQGAWGEMILERILEQSGLRRGVEYTLQGEGMKLKHPETGSHSKPDVIIHLPQGKHLVIDAKVSLEPYRRCLVEEDEAQAGVYKSEFLASIRSHINGLEVRRYQDTESLESPDFVFLFMPIEGAYALALQEDSSLHEFAWNKRIVLVGPWNLYATLRTVGSLWQLERQNKNAQEIAIRGGALYDKFVGFLDDMSKLGTQIEGVQQSYHSAKKKLSEGRGNLVRQVEQLQTLGAKNSKQIPEKFLVEEEDDDAILETSISHENPTPNT